MKKKTKYLWLIGMCLIMISGCTISEGKNSVEGFFSQGSGEDEVILNKRWADLPVAIYISESVPEKFRPDCLEAMDRWNEAAGVQLFDYQGITPSMSRGDDEINAIYWDEETNPKGHFGETRKTWTRDNILIEADVVFFGDPEEFEKLTCEGEKDVCQNVAAKKDSLTTALHELGHVIGFADTTKPDSIMNPHFTQGDVRHYLNEDVVALLKAVYNPVVVAEN